MNLHSKYKFTFFFFISSITKRARPIHKLCEFEGNLTEVYEPDCYKDVDETDYACKEKYRIMVSISGKGQSYWARF